MASRFLAAIIVLLPLAVLATPIEEVMEGKPTTQCHKKEKYGETSCAITTTDVKHPKAMCDKLWMDMKQEGCHPTNKKCGAHKGGLEWNFDVKDKECKAYKVDKAWKKATGAKRGQLKC